jgi:mRNA interferase RelE/StbE
MSITYRVELAPRAAKEIEDFPLAVQKKIIKALDALEVIPRPPGGEKLKDYPPFWRVKAGQDHRIIYMVDDAEKLVLIATIRDRKDAYRNLSGLNAHAIMAAIKPLLEKERAARPPAPQ